MDFKQLRSFAYVVRYGSFTVAAEKLYLSQPTISTHVRQMEEELDTRLIVRTTKRIEVTKKGNEIYDYAVRILKIKERMEECCESDHHQTLHIGVSSIPSCYVLPKILSEYRQLHPDIQFDVRQTDSQGVYDGLNQNFFDVGFAGKNSSDAEFITFPFTTDRMVLITPNTDRYRIHLEAVNENGLPFPNLQEESFISREQGSGSLETAGRLLSFLGIALEDLKICAWVNDSETIKNMVACGLGVSIISEKAAHNFIESGQVLKFNLPEHLSSRKLYVGYRKNSFLSSDAIDFLNFLRQKTQF